MITEQTVSHSWLISIGFHAALLVGMTLVVIERFGSAGGSGGYGMSCAFVERGLGIERIDRSPDDLGSTVKPRDSSPSLDDLSGHGSSQTLPPAQITMYVEEGEGICGNCYDYLVDRIVVLTRQQTVPEPPRGFEYRRRSLEENRTGMPRLKKPWWREATSRPERFGRWPIDCDHQTVLSAAAISDDQLGDGLRCTGCGWPWWVIRASSW